MTRELYHNPTYVPTAADSIRRIDQIRFNQLALNRRAETIDPVEPIEPQIGHSAVNGMMGMLESGGQSIADDAANFIRMNTVGQSVLAGQLAVRQALQADFVPAA